MKLIYCTKTLTWQSKCYEFWSFLDLRYLHFLEFILILDFLTIFNLWYLLFFKILSQCFPKTFIALCSFTISFQLKFYNFRWFSDLQIAIDVDYFTYGDFLKRTAIFFIFDIEWFPTSLSKILISFTIIISFDKGQQQTCLKPWIFSSALSCIFHYEDFVNFYILLLALMHSKIFHKIFFCSNTEMPAGLFNVKI